MTMLHVTNGDAVVDGFRAGAIPGVYLPWRDVLHDGAVPHRESLEALSDVRARELERLGGGDNYEGLRAEFAERDATLTAFADHDEVVLWFEHDLYDQLQLLQLLDWFSRQDRSRAGLSLIQIGEHPEVQPFYGLGQLTGPQLAALLPTRRPVTVRQLELGRQAWAAFCAPDPKALLPFTRLKDDAMPFLADALARLVEEYPAAHDGLSRTERQLLAAAAAGARRRADLYAASQKFESCPWGDLSVYLRLKQMVMAPRPTLERVGNDEFVVTERGRSVLARQAPDFHAEPLDVWIGGVHILDRSGAVSLEG